MSSNDISISNTPASDDRPLLSDEQTGNTLDPDLSRSKPDPGHPSISSRPPECSKASELPVCIIGAGAAGLYTAMIFESLGIDYQIVEGDTRVGGRMFTYHFPNGGPYDYFDVGATRFPDTPLMKRVFDLVRNRGLPVKLIPYTSQMVDPPNTWLLYNNVRVNNRDPSVTGDPFNIGSYVTDPNLTSPQGASKRIAELLQPYRDLFRTREASFDPQTVLPPSKIGAAMEVLLRETGKFSVRGYMLANNMTEQDVHWCETLDRASTGWYDRAFAQAVTESISFNWPTTPLPGPEVPRDPNEGWYCFDGGVATLPRAMFNSLSKKAQNDTLFKSRVTAISRDAQKDTIQVSIDGRPSTQEYSAIISTVPFSQLRFMDLAGINIHDNYAQWSAIRGLQYGSGLKVAIKFRTPWWETELPKPIHGGQSYTDLPIRNVIYPSYPQGAKPEDVSKVLIVSFCGVQDADRLGTFINRDGTAEPELIDYVFRDLAAVHGVTVEWLKRFYTDGDYFAWDWSRHPLSMGTYAIFGPGVYGDADLYRQIILPAARGKLFFAGEATAMCHTWVVAALHSAWRAVDQYLTLHHPEKLDELWKSWGKTEYWDEVTGDKSANLDEKLSG